MANEQELPENIQKNAVELAKHANQHENPEWWFTLFAVALDANGGDQAGAVEFANEAIQKHPHPPEE